MGFTPRKAAICLYGLQVGDGAQDLFDRLGPHRHEAGCVSLTRLDAVDQDVLRELIVRGGESAQVR